MPKLALAALARGLEQAVLLEHPDRRARFASVAYCRLFGFPDEPGAIEGTDGEAAALARAVRFADPAAYLTGVAARIAGGVPATDRLTLADGRVLQRRYVPPAQTGSGHLWVYEDVTDAVAALAEAEARAGAASERVRALGFGLRTQLHAVVALAELGARARGGVDARALMAKLRQGAEGLRWTLEAAFDAARAGEPEAAAPFDPLDVIEGVLAAVSVAVRERGTGLLLHVGEEVPARVTGAAGRLGQLVLNLVAALLDSPGEDAGALVVRLDRARDGRLVVTLERRASIVTDRRSPARFSSVGAVIAEELARSTGAELRPAPDGASVELRFPAGPAPDGDAPAYGLTDARIALAGAPTPETEAVASVARRLGARVVGPVALDRLAQVGDAAAIVAVGSREEPGRRSAAPRGGDGRAPPVVRAGGPALPHPIARAGLAAAVLRALGRGEDAADEGGAPAPARLLLVEDARAHAAALAELLTRAGYTVSVARSAAAALDRHAAETWSLLLMDLDLPDLDGASTAARIRARERATGRRRTPIVACTADATAEARARCAEAGMDGLLLKPVPFELLLATLRRHLDDRPRVVVVDDALDARQLYERWLGALGASVHCFAAAEEALAELARSGAAVVLLDVNLPGLDGVEAARRIRALAPCRDARVVVITGDGAPSTRRRALDAGADAVLVKPIARDTLVARVGRLLAPGGPPPDAEPEEPAVDPDLVELVPEYLAEVRAGIAAFGHSAARPGLAQIQRFGHQLKGSGASYGFPRFSELGAELQDAARSADVARCSAALEALAEALAAAEAQFTPRGA